MYVDPPRLKPDGGLLVESGVDLTLRPTSRAGDGIQPNDYQLQKIEANEKMEA